MFNQARLKLTLWYIAIIFLISSLFSMAFYAVSTQELQRVVGRIERNQNEWNSQFQQPPPPKPGMPTIEELQASSQRLFTSLIFINGIILVISGGAAYFLAGRTLKPIRLMVEEQNQFISNSSHELRTPLATLRAEMEGSLLEKQISDKQARVLVRSNLEEITRLQRLSNNLLQITKLHSPNPTKYSGQVSIEAVVNDAVKQVSKLAKNKRIQIVKRVGNYNVQGDKDSLQELLVILLENAIKYSKKDTKIKISTNKSRNDVVIQVKDQGIGISKKDLPFVFDRFYRSDKSRSQTDGFGLGLSIAKQIVNKHNGTIQVVSKPKKGSVFTVKLPLVKS